MLRECRREASRGSRPWRPQLSQHATGLPRILVLPCSAVRSCSTAASTLAYPAHKRKTKKHIAPVVLTTVHCGPHMRLGVAYGRGRRATLAWVLFAAITGGFVASSHAQPLVGDANCDGTVGAADLAALTAVLFEREPTPECGGADANQDGRWSSADLTAVLRIFAPPAEGPVVSYLGLATPDGQALVPTGFVGGRAVFWRPVGSGFQLVVEGRPGRNGNRPGSTVFAFDPRRPEQRPDLQVLVHRPLGDGSPEVCNGGVPGIDPPDFAPGLRVSSAINDLGCNFTLSGQGSCTLDPFGRPAFAGRGSQIQYCATISRSLAFPAGETIVAVRLRDLSGNLGPIESIVVHVGSQPPTPSPSPTRPASPTASRTIPASSTPTRTVTIAPTRTFTALVPPTSPAPSSPSATRTAGRETSPTPSATRTASRTAAATPTRTATRPAPTVTPSPTRSTAPTLATTVPSRTPTPTPSRTRTVAPSLTPIPSTASATRTSTRTPTRTVLPTSTATSTAVAGAANGPQITFFGLTRADDTLIPASGTTAAGIPLYQRPAGAGFSLVIEAKPGSNGRPVGTETFREGGRPALQVLVSRALGDGSSAVCDRLPPNAGGVPGTDPPQFTDAPEVVDAMNDMGCRFLDGAGQPRGRSRNDACILKPDGGFDFARSDSTVQFCGFVDVPIVFPPGDTLVTVRVADTSGTLGPPAALIIRVGP